MQQEVDESSQEKRDTLEVSSTKGFRVERKKGRRRREEKRRAWPMGMLQKFCILLRCTSVPKGEFSFRNCLEYFLGLGPRKFGTKTVPHMHFVILTYFGLPSLCKAYTTNFDPSTNIAQFLSFLGPNS
jgi:hypothetical protein